MRKPINCGVTSEDFFAAPRFLF